MLLSMFAGIIAQQVAARVLGAAGALPAFALSNLASTIIMCVGYFLIGKAVFTERDPHNEPRGWVDTNGIPLADRITDNPYATPR